MKVCYFGTFDPAYSRNAILISGLQNNGIEVLQCRTDKNGVAKYVDLIRKHALLRGTYDCMVVGFPGFQAVVLARLISSTPIVFDMFLSMYDSMVMDRKSVRCGSLRAWYLWWLDKISATFANVVLLDTRTHIAYVASEFSIPLKKLRCIYIGAMTDIMQPVQRRQSRDPFRIIFWGTYIALQGIQYILRAAAILKNQDVQFLLIGNGQEKKNMIELSHTLDLNNVVFLDSMPPAAIRDEVAKSDVCLGIFGDTEKTQRVIPNKVFESVALGMPTITADTPAMRELFTDDEVQFVPVSNAEAIAAAILELQRNKPRADQIAVAGYKKFIATATPDRVGGELKHIIETLVAH